MIENKVEKLDMKKCEFEDWIDDYLLNRLDEKKKEKFEEHYFNCLHCFERMEERNELISVVKNKGSMIFQEEHARKKAEVPFWFENVVSFLTPKQWAMAGVSAVLVLLAIFFIIPNLKTTTPQFIMNDDTVRGEPIILLSPLKDIKIVPSKFRWMKLGKDVEYRIYIYDSELLWTSTTKDNAISLPEEVKQQMKAGEKYSWQVKAFSQEGSLIAVSSQAEFRIFGKN